MEKEKIYILIDNGHGENTKGKCSPDGVLREWKWAREVATLLKDRLGEEGILSELIVTEDRDVSLSERAKRVNKVVSEKKKEGITCILISIHINAAGSDGKWLNANGWSVYVCNNASKNSKTLAQCLYKYANEYGLKGNRYVPKEKYWVADYTILTKTSCPAILTENLYQDNKDDVAFLLSNEGKDIIVEVHKKGIIEYLNSL